MNKILRNLVRGVVTCCALTAVSSAAYADAGKVYMVGGNNNWYPPYEEYEEYFTPLYETASGSGVYECVFDFAEYNGSASWFRFYSELEEGDFEYDSKTYKIHNICPKRDGLEFDELGRSGFLFSDIVYTEDLLGPYEEAGTWRLNNLGKYKVSLDINAHTLMLYPEDVYLIGINNSARPTVANIGNFYSSGNMKEYVTGNKLELYFYDWNAGSWLNQSGNASYTAGDSFQTDYTNGFTRDTKSGRPISISGWNGGMVTSTGRGDYGYVTTVADTFNDSYDGMFVTMESDPLKPWAGAPDAVMASCSFLERDGDVWKGRISIPEGQFYLNIISKLGNTPDENTVLAPRADGANRELNYVNGMAVSSSVALPASRGGYWFNRMQGDGELEVTVSGNDKSGYTVTFADVKIVSKSKEIYLIGAPNGWNINDDSMPLRLTSNGGYYGSYYVGPGGEAMFRFYRALGDWETNSIGSQYFDEPVVFEIDGSIIIYCMDGKGSFYFPSWPGGMMYMYVDLDVNNITFSDSPILSAGDFIQVTEPMPYDGVPALSINGTTKHSMSRISDGVYSYSYQHRYGEELALRLFTSDYGVAIDEPEWNGAYAVNIQGISDINVGDREIRTFAVTHDDKIGTTPATEFILKNTGTPYSLVELVLDLNANKLTVGGLDGYYLLKADDPIPTVENVGNHEYTRIPYSGGIVDIPAGKFDFWLYQPGYFYGASSFPATPDCQIDFSENPHQVNIEDLNMGWIGKRVQCPDWKGGKLIVSPVQMFDLSRLEEVRAYTSGLEEAHTGILKKVNANSLKFKGTVDFENSIKETARGNTLIGFQLSTVTVQPDENSLYPYERTFYLEVGAELPEYVGGAPINADFTAIFDSMETVAPVGLNTGAISLPNLKGEGVLDLVLDLDAMALAMKVSEDNIGDIMEVVSNGAMLDGARAFENTEIRNALTLTVDNVTANAEGYILNFATSEGSIIVPASGDDTKIDFNSHGFWTGKYIEQTAPAGLKEASIAAAGAPAWTLDVPGDFTDLSILIDRDKKKVTFYSIAHNDDFFIVDPLSLENRATFGNMAYAENHRLMQTEPGVYEGTLHVTPNEVNNVCFTRSFSASRNMYGIMSYYNYPYTLTLSGTDFSNELKAWHITPNWEGIETLCYATNFEVLADKEYVNVIYDSNSNTIILSGYVAGVDEIISEDRPSTLRIIPGNGSVRIISEEETEVEIYSLDGLLVRKVNAPAGTTDVDLRAGFYVAGSSKILVK